MALADMYELVHDMTLFNQNILNVYHCQRTSGVEKAGNISDAFQVSVLPVVRALQITAVINNELRIKNLGDPLDFNTFTLTGAPGLRANVASPGFLAGEIKFARKRSDMRNGFKRFAGLSEIDVTDGNMVASALTLLDNIAAGIVGNWLDSGDAHVVCNYVIIKRICKTTPAPGDPCPQYRLPVSDGELIFYQPTSTITINTARSQVSRRVPT